ncbi:MAG: hypothetical protein Q4E57_06675 [Eubacteriales bacterium]|nr:hypothetical protein [Eubacteriales bacterium]
MKYALIDIGSNTLHLCVYKVEGAGFEKLFNKKIMAGLVSYVEDGMLTEAGINTACEALDNYRQLLELLDVRKVDVFATACLRNIKNSIEARREITDRTGMRIELLSGAEEALTGYYGMVHEKQPKDGFLIDIGGGSTELTMFDNEKPLFYRSYPIGSLNLYQENVKGHILPTEGERESIEAMLDNVFDSQLLSDLKKKKATMYAIGGSARAALKLANAYYDLEPGNTLLKKKQLRVLQDYLCSKGQGRIDLLTKYCPERLHTIVPGLLAMEALCKKLGCCDIDVCSGGVREGYLWNKLQKGEFSND